MDPSQIINQLLAAAGISAAQLPAGVDFSLWSILRAVVIFVAIYILARIVRALLKRVLGRLALDVRVVDALVQIAFYGILVLGIIWILGGFGLSVVVLGIAAGFALKDLIENFAAGLLIMVTRPFQPGDWVMIGSNEGKVLEVGWRGTFLDTFDGRRVIVPNSDIVTNVVTNNSLSPQLRSTIRFNVALESDFTRVEQLVLEALGQVQGIAQSPVPVVLIDNMIGTALNLKVHFWVPTPLMQQGRVISEAWRVVKDALPAEGIDLNPATTIAMSRETKVK